MRHVVGAQHVTTIRVWSVSQCRGRSLEYGKRRKVGRVNENIGLGNEKIGLVNEISGWRTILELAK